MENVFHELQDDMSVELTGAHFASLINAYGCVGKNFDKAISVFETMPTVPRAPPPDAVVFEAVINVIVAHKRTELLPVYVEKMNQANVHMTAYIANFLIKGYANIGDLDKAREIFERLADPPFGIAAPNNHVPHHAAETTEVTIMDPVYREVWNLCNLFPFYLLMSFVFP
jgi:pentatricopeptide repeat protein